MSEINSIALIGAGRVSTHLGAALKAKGLEITAVYDRNIKTAEAFAQKLGVKRIVKIGDKINADLIIIAVSDDAVAEVARQLSEHTKGLVVHTSGAVAMRIIPSYLRRGVFYPLQSFSYDKKIIWENVPFCIEAENDTDVNALGGLAERISRKVYLLSSEQRKALHLAAVFANNFANLMFEFSEELLAKAEIDRSILHPLILETANKVLMQPAAEAQTGPAMRGDLDTIRAHQLVLGENNSLRSVYDVLTREIYNRSQHGRQL
jgi:predicted short-subunit dehydrogenase-like oxidoreductase (DUF2520 family)